ncbi:hypothetical protein ACSBR1_016441 [Camellia fascicularis]
MCVYSLPLSLSYFSCHILVQVILDNGLVRLTIAKPQGFVTSIKYGGLGNLLDLKSSESNRGYWDLNWSLPRGQDRYQFLKGSNYSVIHTSNDKQELSFRSTYDPSTPGIRLPLSVDLRYIMRSGVSAFYCYAIYERPPGCRAFDLCSNKNGVQVATRKVK